MILTHELAVIVAGLESKAVEVGSRLSLGDAGIDAVHIKELKVLCEQFLHNEQVVNLDKLPRLKR